MAGAFLRPEFDRALVMIVLKLWAVGDKFFVGFFVIRVCVTALRNASAYNTFFRSRQEGVM